ncbi:MAG TPA: 16S rRNA processing protein RimM [Armatimonadetes bacterium]|nr:16S rRNA processing protein RimM [Armatimonadota bacterium]
MPEQRDWLVRGVVRGVHGVRGLLKVRLSTDFPERVLEATELTLRYPDGRIEPHRVERITAYREGVLLKLAGVDDRNAAEAFRGVELVAAVDELPPLGPNENYWHELVGLRVVCEDGTEVGTIAEILRTGSNEVYVTEVPSATGRSTRPGPLIPAIPEVVLKVDPAAGVVTIRPLPGLLDED